VRRLGLVAAVTFAAAVAASTAAVAEPQGVPAAPPSASAIANPDRDPAPPASACADLNDIYWWGECSSKCEGISPSYKLVTPVSQACDEMGRAQRDGRHVPGFPPSPPVLDDAFRLFGTACTPLKALPGVAPAVPYWGGCFDQGTLFLKGTGAPRDEGAARRLYAQACGMAAPTVTYEACFALGELLEAGSGGPKDIGAALDAYKKACGASYPRACRAILRIRRR
jgi:TPR repeat protein